MERALAGCGRPGEVQHGAGQRLRVLPGEPVGRSGHAQAGDGVGDLAHLSSTSGPDVLLAPPTASTAMGSLPWHSSAVRLPSASRSNAR